MARRIVRPLHIVLLAAFVSLGGSACEDDGALPGPEQACLANPPSASYPVPEDGRFGCAVDDVIADFRFTLPTDAGEVSRTLGEYQAQTPTAKLLVWLAATGWCGTCRYTARNLDVLYGERGGEGVYVLASLAENGDGDVASADDAIAWRDGLELDYDVVADNCGAGGTDSFGACGASIAELPTIFVIDLASMRILYRATTDRHIADVVQRALEAMP